MSSIIRAAMSKTKTVGEGEDKQAMIALVRRAAELGKSTEAIERVKAGATVSDATAKTYAAACARRLIGTRTEAATCWRASRRHRGTRPGLHSDGVRLGRGSMLGGRRTRHRRRAMWPGRRCGRVVRS